MDDRLNKENVLKSVYDVICNRAKIRPDKSYVVSLFDKGLEKILSKVSEESEEVLEAAREPKEQGTNHLNSEICDLFFHTLVLAAYKEIPFEQIEREFIKRFGLSGIEEKESRKGKNDEDK